MADPSTKPDLAKTRERLHGAALYLLEILARTQATGSPSAVLTVASLQQLAQSVTGSMMDVEAYL